VQASPQADEMAEQVMDNKMDNKMDGQMGASAVRRQQASALIDDLIETRLDTSQWCGVRYPLHIGAEFAPSHQRQSRAAGAPLDGGPGSWWAHQQQQQRQEVELELDVSATEQSAKRGPTGSGSGKSLFYIVGGDQVEDEHFWPWSVAIFELDPLNGQKGFICSGSLISEHFVLTAAHCIQQSRFDILRPEEIFLKIASIRLDDLRADFYQVERIHLHPDYTVDRKTNDIALLRLRSGQRLPERARPICLPSNVANRVDFTDQQVTIIGWGKTSVVQGHEPTRLIDIIASSAAGKTSGKNSGETSSKTSGRTFGVEKVGDTREEQQADNSMEEPTNETLLQAQVRVTNTEQCNKNYSKLEIDWLNIDEHFICASDPQGKRDACQGDSGGPLMWNTQQHYHAASEKWYQLGLVSFGYGCANSQYPGVYTRISYYMPWILRIVNERRPPINHHQAQSQSLPQSLSQSQAQSQQHKNNNLHHNHLHAHQAGRTMQQVPD